MVLQSLEGLSDRDAIEALRTDLRWKVAAGLRLDDEGFHPTVLTLWRNKLRASDRPKRIFDAVRAVIAESGAIAGQDPPSARLDGAGRRGGPSGRDHAVGRADPKGAPPDPRKRVGCRCGPMTTTAAARNRRARGTTRPISNGS